MPLVISNTPPSLLLLSQCVRCGRVSVPLCFVFHRCSWAGKWPPWAFMINGMFILNFSCSAVICGRFFISCTRGSEAQKKNGHIDLIFQFPFRQALLVLTITTEWVSKESTPRPKMPFFLSVYAFALLSFSFGFTHSVRMY